jgi:hypothetical protein
MPKPGETVRYDCNSCNTEFEVTLEPKAKGHAGPPGEPSQIPAQKVQFCPFCGADEDRLSGDDEDG